MPREPNAGLRERDAPLQMPAAASPDSSVDLQQPISVQPHRAMPSSSRSTAAGGNAKATRPTLEIIPDTRFIVFRGLEHEAPPCTLSGVVRLTTSGPMSIAKPRIRFNGSRKVSWWHMGGIGGAELSDKKAFWSEELKLGSIETTHKIKAGVIEWPFEFQLSSSMPESVEGLSNTYCVYHLNASISRPGWSSKDLVAQEHIRLVRTLGPESVDAAHSRVNSDIWASKLSYSISIPTDAYVFGTSITADVELSPIKKGLRLGNIDLQLNETVVKRVQFGEMADPRLDRTKTEETTVAKHEMEFPENSKVMYDDESTDNPTMEDEMYRFKATLPLPKSLNECRQDVDSHLISISHKFKLLVNLHNPEGHVSQLVCRLPVKIFISPNLPVNEANEVCRPVNDVTDEAINNNETTISAPPQYGLHQLDELFNDIDSDGYMSRVPSNSSSPGPHAQTPDESQVSSAALNGLPSRAPLESQEHASTVVLQRRLANLEAERRLSSHTENESASRRSSGEDIRQDNYNIRDLSRVPSYRHALQTPGSVSAPDNGPPTYIEATSRSSSPPRPPPQAHMPGGTDRNSQAGQQSRPTDVAICRSSIESQARTHRRRSSHASSLARREGLRTRLVPTAS